MKLYAQSGYGDGQKTADGLTQGLIDGVIFSPKDVTLARLRATVKQVRQAQRRADVLFDPQFYATIPAVDPAASLSNLVNEIDGAQDHPYFQSLIGELRAYSATRFVKIRMSVVEFRCSDQRHIGSWRDGSAGDSPSKRIRGALHPRRRKRE